MAQKKSNWTEEKAQHLETAQKFICSVGWCNIKMFKNKTEQLMARKTALNLKNI